MESQSTINWLEEEIRGNVNMSNRDFRKLWLLLKEARELEKRQIKTIAMTCFIEGKFSKEPMSSTEFILYGERFYKQTYETKE